MRNYPKKAGQIDQKKQERAFIQELRKLLSKRYRYVIVADRGFGNVRFMKCCQEAGFHYLVRTEPHWKTQIGETLQLMNQLTRQNYDYSEIILQKQNFKSRLVTCFKGKSGWYILTDLEEQGFLAVHGLYSRRFSIEKMFQDFKSSGLDIENSKIQKYSNMKRLLFASSIASSLITFIGDFMEDNDDNLRKKFPVHFGIISAFSS